jgi:hypothetical protein
MYSLVSGMLPRLRIFLCFSLFPLSKPTFFCHDRYDPIYSYFPFPYRVLARTVFDSLDEYPPFFYSLSCD